MIEPTGVSSCKMMTPPGAFVTGSGNRQQPIAVPPPLVNSNPGSTGSKRRGDYVDPCQIAPLKKRKIQVSIRLVTYTCYNDQTAGL